MLLNRAANTNVVGSLATECHEQSKGSRESKSYKTAKKAKNQHDINLMVPLLETFTFVHDIINLQIEI